MRPPEQIQDGYTLTWTARWSRDDWRRAGVPARETTERVTIQNGRITRWTSSVDSAEASGAVMGGAASVDDLSPGVTVIDSGADGPITPPPSLVAAGVVVLVGIGLGVRSLVGRSRADEGPGPVTARIEGAGKTGKR
jgi:hypothetical protein